MASAPAVPRSARAFAQAGDRARDARRWSEAAQSYEQALQDAPRWDEIWVQLGHMRKEAGEFEAAERAYAQGLRLAPDHADTWLHLGYMLKRVGREADAARALARSDKLSPGNPAVQDGLADLARRGVRPDGREPQLAGEPASAPIAAPAKPPRPTAAQAPSKGNDDPLHALLRATGLRRGPHPESLKLSRQGDAARDRRDWPQAADRYQAALKADPARPNIWVQLGHSRKEAGDLKGAETAYFEAMRREPDNGDTHLNLGHVLKLGGRPAEAYAAYKRAVELEPAREDWVRELLAASRALNPEGDGADAPAGSPSVPSDPLLAFLRQVHAGAAPAQTAAALAPAEMARVAEFLQPPAVEPTREAPSSPSAAALAGGAAEAQAAAVLFDVTDLMGFFRHSRLPTGIQRVQIETVSAVLREPPSGLRAAVCAFSEGLGGWTAIPSAAFLDVARLALASEDAAAMDWRLAVGRLELAAGAAGVLTFPRGAALVNLGASWEQGNYFLALRAAKARSGVRYIPFLHDLIPVFAPGFHVEDLTRDFIGWLRAVLAHADGFLANSEHTLKDLREAAGRMGAAIDPARTQVIPLDARIGSEMDDHAIDAEVLRKHGLEAGRFVLFVSTIEPRKNHLVAFGAWSQLLRDHGARAPRLVCVGRRGWLNEAVIGRLESDPQLRDSVKVISGASDHALATLYKACAFTLYPSRYEGWGLPITESLCYGKVPLIADTPSLQEAGGGFAEVFEQGSERRLAAAAERLYFDEGHRRERERAIAEGFRPRRWSELGAQIVGAADRWRDAEKGAEVRGAAPFPLELGRYYPLARNRRVVLGPELESAEAFRRGDGWNGPDWWGTWTRPGPALLSFAVSSRGRPVRLYLGLRGPPGDASRFTVAAGGETIAEGRLEADRVQWICRTLPAEATAAGELTLSITGDAAWPLDGREERRTGSVGVVGLMVCEEGDLLARSAFVEEHLTEQLKLLA